MATLNDDDRNDECVKHALKVRSAWWLGNYHVLFKLFKSAPRMAAFLMGWFISRERKIALKNMLKSYVYLVINFLSLYSFQTYITFIFHLNDKKKQQYYYHYSLVNLK